MSFFRLPGSMPAYIVKVSTRKVVGFHLVGGVELYFLSPPTTESVCAAIMEEFEANGRAHKELIPWSKADRAAHLRGARECIDVVRRVGIPEMPGRAASVHVMDDRGIKRPRKSVIAKMARISVTRVWAKP